MQAQAAESEEKTRKRHKRIKVDDQAEDDDVQSKAGTLQELVAKFRGD